ncbi:lymphocyte antigen 6D-like [Trichosurus vulpecula]|uniref:lymphocyte antigen 6D-like n=1 Tax=Trichosurus vulpecula TaxID=9337 RepID=UPI00186AD648|nr:lymphocyte antigen 6D-like [Trichosurus vulpecula]
MKSLLMLLAVAAITIGQAQALRCYVCESSDNCKKLGYCPNSSQFCRTTISFHQLSGNLVKKECADYCTEQNANPSQIQPLVRCCKTDLCNYGIENSAPVHMVLSHAVLALSLTLALVSVLYWPSL